MHNCWFVTDCFCAAAADMIVIVKHILTFRTVFKIAYSISEMVYESGDTCCHLLSRTCALPKHDISLRQQTYLHTVFNYKCLEYCCVNSYSDLWNRSFMVFRYNKCHCQLLSVYYTISSTWHLCRCLKDICRVKKHSTNAQSCHIKFRYVYNKFIVF